VRDRSYGSAEPGARDAVAAAEYWVMAVDAVDQTAISVSS